MNYTVVIDGVGTSTAQNVLSSLLPRKDYRTIGLDMSEVQAGKFLVDKFVLCPSAKSDEFIPFLTRLFRSIGGNVLYIPIIDYGFAAIAKTDFGDNVIPLISPNQTIHLCDDKLEMSAFFELGSDRPFCLPLDSRSLSLDTCTYPLVTKPRREGRASLDVCFVKDSTEAKKALKGLGTNAYYQEVVTGREVTVDVLCSLDGDFISYVCRERLEVKAGVCHKAYCFKSLRYEHIVKYISKMLRFKGPFNAQFIETVNGDIYLIEINPRFSGGLNLSLATGWDPFVVLHLLTEYAFAKEKPCKIEALQSMMDRRFKEGYAFKISHTLFETKGKII